MSRSVSEKPLSIRALCLLAIQTHPGTSFKVQDIFEQVKSEKSDLKKISVANVISSDFLTLNLVKRLPSTKYLGRSREYAITQQGKDQDPYRIPSFIRNPSLRKKAAMKRAKVEEVEEVTPYPNENRSLPVISTINDPESMPSLSFPEGITDVSQVIKNQNGNYKKLSGEIDAVSIGEAFLDYIAELRGRVTRLSDGIVDIQSQSRKDADFFKLEIKRKDSKILELEKLVEKLQKNSLSQRRTFNLADLAEVKFNRK